MDEILLVEDNSGDVHLIKTLLNEEHDNHYSLIHADRIRTALDLIANRSFSMILLDLSLPDSSGLDSVHLIRQSAPNLPIVVLTGINDNQMALEALSIGAQDFLVKDEISGALLWRCMRYAVERKKKEDQLHRLALYDSLTKLPNRTLFKDRLLQAIERTKRGNSIDGKQEIAIMLLDLNNFKRVNDTFGHPTGDALLQNIAERLGKSIRQSDTLARIGGDEFMLIFEQVNRPRTVLLVEKVLQAFAVPFSIQDESIHMTCSIGISLYPEHGDSFSSLMKTADQAMYKAKNSAAHFCFYDEVEIS